MLDLTDWTLFFLDGGSILIISVPSPSSTTVKQVLGYLYLHIYTNSTRKTKTFQPPNGSGNVIMAIRLFFHARSSSFFLGSWLSSCSQELSTSWEPDRPSSLARIQGCDNQYRFLWKSQLVERIRPLLSMGWCNMWPTTPEGHYLKP